MAMTPQQYRDTMAKKKKYAEDAKKKKEGGVPKVDTLLEMPTLNSASVASAEEASLLAQSKRRGRASTLLSDPNEQPLGAQYYGRTAKPSPLSAPPPVTAITPVAPTAPVPAPAPIRGGRVGGPGRKAQGDSLGETVLANEEVARLKAEELKKKKLVAMGLYTAPTTILGG